MGVVPEIARHYVNVKKVKTQFNIFCFVAVALVTCRKKDSTLAKLLNLLIKVLVVCVEK